MRMVNVEDTVIIISRLWCQVEPGQLSSDQLIDLETRFSLRITSPAVRRETAFPWKPVRHGSIAGEAPEMIGAG